MKLWALALVLAGACGGSSARPATVEKPRAPADITCVGVANNMATQVLAHKSQPQQDRLVAIIEIIKHRCEQDRWSIEARQCLATMRTEDEADQCSTYLTDAQLTAMVHDERARFGRQDEGEPPPPAAQAAPPPPPAAAPSPTRGPKPKPAPSGAGETKSDPCQGGE